MTNQKRNLTELVLNERANFQRYVRRKIADISEMDAEDIVADVVFNLYNKINIEQQVESMLAYAYRAISNKIVDYLRQRKVTESFNKVDKTSGLALSEIIPDHSANIETKIRNEELNRRLYAALRELDSKQRDVWLATEMEDRTFKELSAEWGEPVGTLLSRKSRASQLLKIRLKNVI
jgi:RNA polymerase sigma factor (sigma-70 family)